MTRQLTSYVALVVLFGVSFLVLNWIYGYVVAVQSETNDCFFMFGRQFLLEFFDHPPACCAMWADSWGSSITTDGSGR